MYAYKLILAYDGTSYSGWQVQPHSISIQQKIEEALSLLLHCPTSVIGSGRTDAGVHAFNQVAHFRCSYAINEKQILKSLNALLPLDIRIKSLTSVPLDFHARYSAIRKEYHYYLYLDPIMDPFRRLYCWHVRPVMDLEILKQSVALFIGTHDFTSFANEPQAGAVVHNPVRTLYRLDIRPFPGGICLEFEGNGFLRKMVRNMVGTLVEVSIKKRPFEEICSIFEAKDRRRAGRAAPPQGLFLVNVLYP